jgi:hypothetical protein
MFVLVAVLLLAGCDRLPDTYAPPEQRHPVQGPNPAPESMMAEMGSPDADFSIVKDIYGRSDPSWRWTAQNPTVHMLLGRTENLTFIADFSIWEDAFKVTGPVTIAYLVNNRVLEQVHYATPGLQHFEKAVPAAWLSKESETTLAMSVDKLYVSPRDGMRFGVILVRLGLKP